MGFGFNPERRTVLRLGVATATGLLFGATNEPENLAKTAFGAVSDVGSAAITTLFPSGPELAAIDKAAQQSLKTRIAETRQKTKSPEIDHPELYRNMQRGFSYASPSIQMNGPHGAAAGLEQIFKENIFSQVRLEMPWVTPNGDITERSDGSIDTRQIKPFLDLAVQYGVTPWINVGPIKYFRWPEDSKQPFTLYQKGGIKKPGHGTEITADSALGQRSLQFLLRELQALRDILPPGYPVNIQPDNEPKHPFGDNQWTIDDEMLIQEALLIDAYNPQSKLLYNSAGRNDAIPLISTIKKLVNTHPQFTGRCVLGIDFYSFFDKGNELSTYDQKDTHDKNPSYHTVKDLAKNAGIEIQISELQGEEWGQPQLLKTNSLRFNMEWCVKNMLLTDKPYSVSMWGAELLGEELGKNPRSKNVEKILAYYRQLKSLAA